jgi:hypothetical protein
MNSVPISAHWIPISFAAGSGSNFSGLLAFSFSKQSGQSGPSKPSSSCGAPSQEGQVKKSQDLQMYWPQVRQPAAGGGDLFGAAVLAV